jgi:hypothetical protein
MPYCWLKLLWQRWQLLLALKLAPLGGLSDIERTRILSRFLQDCEEHFVLLVVERGIIDQAVELTQQHRLRGYVAVQLAAVLMARQADGRSRSNGTYIYCR